MPAVFERYTPENAKAPEEWVRITLAKGDCEVADESFRPAADKDRVEFRDAYKAFQGGVVAAPVVPVAAEPLPVEAEVTEVAAAEPEAAPADPEETQPSGGFLSKKFKIRGK